MARSGTYDRQRHGRPRLESDLHRPEGSVDRPRGGIGARRARRPVVRAGRRRSRHRQEPSCRTDCREGPRAGRSRAGGRFGQPRRRGRPAVRAGRRSPSRPGSPGRSRRTRPAHRSCHRGARQARPRAPGRSRDAPTGQRPRVGADAAVRGLPDDAGAPRRRPSRPARDRGPALGRSLDAGPPRVRRAPPSNGANARRRNVSVGRASSPSPPPSVARRDPATAARGADRPATLRSRRAGRTGGRD